ncbi:protein FAR1-RELATED SEQUENCE 4-like [Juglans regia]|uniref:Protein FAR1-RELATED SEQUENCE n=1 Tax=Juglans regia TaxID=51240 RepID=A0A6P9F0Y3_JUGRE|nr:protein FAR1-RELATED SEQUENCE 4-like [Juglans regia]
MLERASKFKRAFDRLEEEDPCFLSSIGDDDDDDVVDENVDHVVNTRKSKKLGPPNASDWAKENEEGHSPQRTSFQNEDVAPSADKAESRKANLMAEFKQQLQSEDNLEKTSSDVNKVAEAEETNEISDDDERIEDPKPGMEFATDKELLAYYKRYAKQQGFGVITQRTKRDASGKPKYVTIGCARGGKYHPSHSNILKPRPTIKTDCKAKLNTHLDKKGVWVLTTPENTHNHSTLSPQKSRFFRSHKCLDEYSKRMLDLNDRASIRMNKNFGALVVDAGGFENLEFQEKDCRNYIDKTRHLRLGKGDGEALSDYFKRMMKMNDGFISVIDVDDELRLKNVFWADARSRAAYECFGDVIIFDTTYLTNRYGMPFAPFVGAPKAIITDQDRAMKSAIAMVFPETRHRYCLWHIMRKLPEKLGSHSQFNAGLKTDIQTALYDSHTCEEFDAKWGELIQKYDLGDNTWLEGLYTERSFWVPVYLKDVFWAGMSTTQRSESMNAFFDGYVHSGTTLKEFVDQFDNALRKKVEVETTADFNSCNQTIPCVTPFHFEKQFKAVYTNAKFKEIQGEVWGMIYCNCIPVSKQGCISTFDVLDEIFTGDHVKTVYYIVYYNDDECDMKCTCALFQMRGIICRHVFKVCQMKKIHVLPEKYILDQWRKDLKRRYTLVKSSYDDLHVCTVSDERHNADVRRYELVVKRCMKLATRVSPSDNHVNAFMRILDEFEHNFKGLPLESGSTKVNESDVVDKGKKILSPNVVRGKGRPPTKRKVPPVEKATIKRKKKQTCRKIFDDEQVGVGEVPAPQVGANVEDVVVGTQYSTVTQQAPSGNDENL